MTTPDEINEMLQAHWPNARVRCEAVSPTEALAVVEPRPENYRPGDVISGPMQFGTADAALWFLVCGALGRAEPMVFTSELSIRYLRRATGDRLWARATLERKGRRALVGSVRVWTTDEQEATAVAQGTYTLP